MHCMGNCCKTASSSMEFAKHKKGSSKVFDEGNMSLEKEKLLSALRASSDANGKVKIKISKKELAMLLGSETNKQHDAEQVLAGLIKNARDHHQHDLRPWKPMLQSIPEVN